MIDLVIRETRAVINLEAVENNLHIIRTLAPNAQLMPTVKADAYGHGTVAIAKTCIESNTEIIAVATLEELLLLRKHHITIPVLILGDMFPAEIEISLHNSAILSVGSISYAKAVSRIATQMHITAHIHVNIETGMGRLGLYTKDTLTTLMEIAELPYIKIEGMFTHFPSADEDEAFTKKQIQNFLAFIQQLPDKIHIRFCHAANSAAILHLPPNPAFNLVRPGIAMYGMYETPNVHMQRQFRPALSLTSKIIRLTRYHSKATIGYGRSYTVKKGSVIAIIPIGYGDGYPRLLSNRGTVLVHAERVPIAGHISMDLLAVDVTKLTEPAALYQEVVLIGAQTWKAQNGKEYSNHITTAELAKLTHTISYEITCGITSRVPRIYVKNDSVVGIQTQTGYREIQPSSTEASE